MRRTGPVVFVLCSLWLAVASSGAPTQSASPRPGEAVKPPAAMLAQARPPAATPVTKKFRVLLPFRVGITFFPISLANELGYLKEEGFDLDLQVANGSSAVVQQLGAGNAEIGVILAPNTLLGFSEGVRYKAFYDFLTRNSFDVKVLDGSPINALPDLKGKSVGTIDLTRGDLPLLRVQLQRAGLDPGRDVNFVALGPTMSLHAQALKDGRVQALNLSWNNTVSVEAAGARLKCITCDSQELQLASETTVAPDGIFARDRRYIVGLGRAMAKATLFAETNPDAAIAIMKRVAPQEHTDPVFTKTFFNAALAVMKPRRPGKYGLSDLGSWERLQDFLATASETQATGLKTKVDVRQLVTNELVDEFNQFDTDAVRKQAREYRP
jgi:NitT/TauT family transport system substrate-binding protein